MFTVILCQIWRKLELEQQKKQCPHKVQLRKE